MLIKQISKLFKNKLRVISGKTKAIVSRRRSWWRCWKGWGKNSRDHRFDDKREF